MFTQPSARGNDGQPVPRNLWPFFSTSSQATTILGVVKALSPDAQIFDGLYMDVFIPVQYADEDCKIWVIKGTVTNPNGGPPLAIDEFVGSLWDRQFRPNPFVDRPGKTLLATPIAPDLAQLSWGKAPE